MAALPPMSEVVEMLRTAVLPAAGVAAAVYFVASLLPLLRRGALPAALAIACGFVAGRSAQLDWSARCTMIRWRVEPAG